MSILEGIVIRPDLATNWWDEAVQLKIRIKEPLRAAIEEDADTGGVTMNAAINDRLEQSFREDARSRKLREALALALGADVAAVTFAIGLPIRDVVKWPSPPPKTGLHSNASIVNEGGGNHDGYDNVSGLAIRLRYPAATTCRRGPRKPQSNGAYLATTSAGKCVGKSPNI
jgi:hypothetical protein